MSRRKRLAVIGSIVGLLMVASAVAYAVFDATVTNGVNNIRIKSNDGFFITSSTTFVDVPGASFNMAVPNGQQKTFIAEFSAESRCYNGDPGDWCGIRIMIDDVEMLPSNADFAFDSVGESDDRWEGNYVTRYAADVGEGQHTFTVQARTTDANTDFVLDDWVFMVTKASQK